MANSVDISGLDKGLLLYKLWENSIQRGLGLLSTDHVTLEDCQEAVKTQSYFDYINGRVIKCDISGKSMKTWAYDRDLGPGSAELVVSRVRKIMEEQKHDKT